MANNLHRHVKFGLFDFRPETADLRREGTAVRLARQPARVLALLVSRPGEVIGRDEFRQALWGDDTFVDFERGLNFCITQVRTALGDSSENPRFIQTVPRRGYRFIAPVAELPPDGQSVPNDPPLIPIAIASSGTLLASATATRRGKFWFGVALAATVITVWYGWGIRRGTTPTQAMAGGSHLRVAVLPIANLTGDLATADIADGLTDELITQLGSIGGERIAVIARTSAMAYRSPGKSIADIARELQVEYAVEGALRKHGHTFRLTGSLIAASTETAVERWEEIIDSSTSSPQASHAYATIRIARRAAMRMAPRTDTETTASSTTPAAWERFLQATAALNRGTPEDISRSISELEAAVQIDSQFAAAWARLAEIRHLAVMMGMVAPNDAYPAARVAADRALSLRSDLPSAHLALGLLQLWYDWRPADAAASFERALALNPSLAPAHHDYAWALAALGRTDDAIRHISRARDLDPLSPRANNDVGWLYLHVRQPENATHTCQHTLAIDAKSVEAQACLERSFASRQLYDAAFEAARATLANPEELLDDANASARERLLKIWHWRLNRLEQAAGSRWVSPYTLAVHYALTGDKQRALAALEAAYAARVGAVVLMTRDPALDGLRGDPQFDALLQKVTAPSS